MLLTERYYRFTATLRIERQCNWSIRINVSVMFPQSFRKYIYVCQYPDTE